MAPQTPQPGGIQFEPSRTTGASSNALLAETQQQRRHQLVHHDSAIAVTENMAQDAHFKKVPKTGPRNIRQQHAIECEQLHISVSGGQLTIQRTAGVLRELCHQFIVACNGKPPSSTKAFVRTVREIDHPDVIISGIVRHEILDKCHRERTKQALKTLDEATES